MAEEITVQQYFNRLSLPDLKIVTDVVSAVQDTVAEEAIKDDFDIYAFWVGVYAIGSYARGEQQPKSDVDLLIAHNFWFLNGASGFREVIWDRNGTAGYNQEGPAPFNSDSIALAATEAIIKEFPKRKPRVTGELPSSYNDGSVERKAMARFVGPIAGRSALDLVCFRGINTYVDGMNGRSTLEEVRTLEEFLEEIDVSADGTPLSRIPLFEWSPSEGIIVDLKPPETHARRRRR